MAEDDVYLLKLIYHFFKRNEFSLYEIRRHTLSKNRVDTTSEPIIHVGARSYQEAHEMAKGVVDCDKPDDIFAVGHQFLTARHVRYM